MDNFQEYLISIKDLEHKEKLTELFEWILGEFPELDTRVAWNQPIFTHHDTFIMGFSYAKKHFSVAPEVAGMKKFQTAIEGSGYSQTNNLFRIQWNQEIDKKLLKEIIEFNILDKADCQKFWR